MYYGQLKRNFLKHWSTIERKFPLVAQVPADVGRKTEHLFGKLYIKYLQVSRSAEFNAFVMKTLPFSRHIKPLSHSSLKQSQIILDKAKKINNDLSSRFISNENPVAFNLKKEKHSATYGSFANHVKKLEEKHGKRDMSKLAPNLMAIFLGCGLFYIVVFPFYFNYTSNKRKEALQLEMDNFLPTSHGLKK